MKYWIIKILVIFKIRKKMIKKTLKKINPVIRIKCVINKVRHVRIVSMNNSIKWNIRKWSI